MGAHLHLLAACCLPASIALAGLAIPQPLVLLNTSPSEPLGLYVRSPGAPQRGRLAAFRLPEAGQAYAKAHLPRMGRGGVLKRIVGGEGDLACSDGGVLSLNGEVLGPLRARDAAGRALPQWRDCRRLARGELLVFSDRIANSYDSRYYGPIAGTDLIGVFEPLWVRR